MKKYKFLIINTHYDYFIENVYKKNPTLKKKSFKSQYETGMKRLFGTSDFYSKNLKKIGYESIDVIYNHMYIQKKWAKENKPLLNKILILRKILFFDKFLSVLGLSSVRKIWFDLVLYEQIKKMKPNVIYNMAMESVGSNFFRRIKKKYSFVRFVVGQHAAPITKTMNNLSSYDLIVSAVPNLVDYFRSKGVKSEYFRLGFETEILKNIKKNEIKEDIIFIGGLSNSLYKKGISLLTIIAKSFKNLQIYGYYDKTILENSILLKKYKGELWGIDMYNKIYNSKIIINRHSNLDVIGNFACNMRLYEVTGVGSLLLTDNIPNIDKLFIPGKEIVVYDSPDDCAKKIRYYLKHDKERENIAKAGQRRTLREHTYLNRMKELIKIINKHFQNKKNE